MDIKMKLTNKQQKDLDTILYFSLERICKKEEITNKDIEDFFAFSERGIKPEIETKGYKELNNAKGWRGVHVGMYEEGVLDGTMPYIVILEGAPRCVVDFMKREMFKGIDAEVIENCYQILCDMGNAQIR